MFKTIFCNGKHDPLATVRHYKAIVRPCSHKAHIYFVSLNSIILQAEEVKELEIHLERRLNYKRHIQAKRKQFGPQTLLDDWS